MRDRQRDYIDWVFKASLDEGVTPDDVLTDEAATLLGAKLKTPLQIGQHLVRAFEVGFENIVEAVLSGKLDELEPQLTRNGYDLRSLVEQFAAKPAEIRQLLRGDLSGGLRRRSAGWARSPGNRPFSARISQQPRRYPSPAFCVATLDLASVSPSLRSVSNSVRRTHPPVSATLCQKPPLIARRAVHHDCAPLQVLRWRSDPSRGEPRFLTVRQEGMCAGYCYRSPCWFAPLGSSQQSATPRRTVPWSFCRRNCGQSRRRRECAT